ncbi:hypothetical protein JVW21_21140, partial [Vibrio cholerae O1]|uniref:hypothetical protein n=1 Tax=Vibrio cholerae TaxID=666 RepID=UPI001C11D73B
LKHKNVLMMKIRRLNPQSNKIIRLISVFNKIIKQIKVFQNIKKHNNEKVINKNYTKLKKKQK